MDTPRGRGVQFPFAVTDRVIIKVIFFIHSLKKEKGPSFVHHACLLSSGN